MSRPTPTARPTPAASRAEVIARLRAHEAEMCALGVTRLHLFGSAARDELASDSDVDVFIDYASETFDYFKLCDLEDLLARILQRDVDVPTRLGLHPHLRPVIEASAIEVF